MNTKAYIFEQVNRETVVAESEEEALRALTFPEDWTLIDVVEVRA